MRDMIAARVQLKNVVRALENRPDATAALGSVQENAGTMENYLSGLTQEFEDNYRDFSEVQERYQARAAAVAKAVAEGRDPQTLDNEPWMKLQSLSRLTAFLEREPTYQEEFVARFDAATKQLRQEMARVLS